jgi:hypothetical protein
MAVYKYEFQVGGPCFSAISTMHSFFLFMKVKKRLSTAFYPQTDGQIERQNQTLEYYFRIFCAYQQDDWVAYLGFAVFVYNKNFLTRPFRPHRINP